jgi:FkbM family methyltransferase
MELPAVLKGLYRTLGFDVRRWPPVTDDEARRATLLRNWKIEAVLDVGANIGQYGLALRRSGYRGRVLSFEPLDSAREVLERVARTDPEWGVRGEALGDERCSLDLHVAGNSQSSSLLPMKEQHLKAAPESACIGRQVVEVHRLDELWPTLGLAGECTFLKIDAQGYEKRILEGAGDVLAGLRGLQLELSLEALYEGEVLFEDMLAWVGARGFVLSSLEPGFFDPRTGRLLQVDGVFENRRLQSS